jgi:hypothetical protein
MTSFQKASAYAAERYKKGNFPKLEGLRMFPYSVQVVHEDGSSMLFMDARAEIFIDKDPGDCGDASHPGEYLCVYTEHQGLHVFCIEDLLIYSQYQPIEIPRPE